MNETLFSAPPDAERYCHKVQKQIEDYIDYKLWEGITHVQLERWLNNFNTLEERYFASRLLDNLIYRSEEQVISMLKQLFQVILPNLVRKHSLSLPTSPDYSTLFNNGIFNSARLVAAFRPKDPPSKSAAHLARLIKRRFGRNIENIMVFPHSVNELRKEISTFIFFDDLLGTGDQFSCLLEEHNIDTNFDKCAFIYIPLVGHEKGIQKLKESYPNLIVQPIEILNSRNQIFHEDSDFFNDGQNTNLIAKNFYNKMLLDKGLDLYGGERAGHGGLDLAYVFSHAIPDNCSPIFYFDENNWQPLFKR